jgi:hypothetical protein
MAKGNNAFDNLLASGTWAKPENRQAFESMVADEPWLKEAVMLRSDYSRNLDEMRPKVEKADKWDTWMSENWDDEHGMTKAEYALQQRNAEIQRRLEAAALGEGAVEQVTFDELNTHLNAKVKELGLDKLVAKDEFETVVKTAKEEGVAYNNYTAHLATRATYLAVKHDKEFGELVDPNDIFKFANENKISDLDAAYDKMVSDKRKAIGDADLQKKLDAAKEEGRKAALQERGMSEGSMPVDMGGPDMGHFAKKLMAGGDKSGSAVPDEVPLGSVASQAARIYEQRAIEGRNA